MQTLLKVDDAVIKVLRTLLADRQQQLLDFAEFLQTKTLIKEPRKSIKGLWADTNIDITEEDMAEAKREMWGNFPKDIEL